MLDEKSWLTVSALIHPKGVLLGSGEDSVQASQVSPPQTHSLMSLWTLFCALVQIIWRKGDNGVGFVFFQGLGLAPLFQ